VAGIFSQKNETIKIIYLGNGFEMTYGARILSFLMFVPEKQDSENIIHQRVGNKEITKLRLVDLKDFDKDNVLIKNKDEFTSYSAFTISRAIEWLKENKYLNSNIQEKSK
jgi:hypothetical protein